MPADTDKRRRRSPTWAEQLVPTTTLLREAIAAGEQARAVELIDFIDHEWIGLNFGFYAQWHADAERFLATKGVSAGDIEGLRGDLLLLVNTHWAPGTPYDREAELQRYRVCKARLLRELNAPPEVALDRDDIGSNRSNVMNVIESNDSERDCREKPVPTFSHPALATLAAWKEMWRGIHDRDVDFASGLLNAAVVRFGEAVLEELYRAILGERFAFRYARFDVSNRPWSEAFDDLVHVSIEAQRSHLSGPERDGSMEFEEHADRVVLSFAPCPTGGRSTAGDRLSGTPSRHAAPYYFRPISGRHDFAWNKQGVCAYCAHCAMLVGKLPIERFGYPLRVIDPPLAGDAEGRCRWTLYRDLRDIPATAYAALGESKPGASAPLGSASRGRRGAGEE